MRTHTHTHTHTNIQLYPITSNSKNFIVKNCGKLFRRLTGMLGSKIFLKKRFLSTRTLRIVSLSARSCVRYVESYVSCLVGSMNTTAVHSIVHRDLLDGVAVKLKK